jgi:hypothetical protein
MSPAGPPVNDFLDPPTSSFVSLSFSKGALLPSISQEGHAAALITRQLRDAVSHAILDSQRSNVADGEPRGLRRAVGWKPMSAPTSLPIK